MNVTVNGKVRDLPEGATIERTAPRYQPESALLSQEALQERHALNPYPEKVTDQPFVSGGDFFDARDVVQVRYPELLN